MINSNRRRKCAIYLTKVLPWWTWVKGKECWQFSRYSLSTNDQDAYSLSLSGKLSDHSSKGLRHVIVFLGIVSAVSAAFVLYKVGTGNFFDMRFAGPFTPYFYIFSQLLMFWVLLTCVWGYLSSKEVSICVVIRFHKEYVESVYENFVVGKKTAHLVSPSGLCDEPDRIVLDSRELNGTVELVQASSGIEAAIISSTDNPEVVSLYGSGFDCILSSDSNITLRINGSFLGDFHIKLLDE